MTQLDLSPPEVTTPEPDPDDRSPDPNRSRRRRIWVGILLGLLAAYVGVALATAWAHWGQMDPNNGSVARQIAGNELSPEEHPFYYWMLWLHIFFSSIALGTVTFQVWPWFRRKHPKAHRVIGRIYAFGGVFPAVVAALIVQYFWAFSVVTAFSQVVPLVLWAFVTAVGLVLRRQGRTDDHRRWMIRSFALTSLVLVELTIDPFVQLAVLTQFESRLEGNMDIYMQAKDSTENWLGLVLVIVIVEGLFEWERLRRGRSRAAAVR